MPVLPQATIGNTISEAEALTVIQKLKPGKVCGPDGIPGEVFRHVPVCKAILLKFLQRMWEEEDVYLEFAKTVFVMLHKKGSPDDPTKYRCIGLLGHAYKALPHCLLKRINEETNDFHSHAYITTCAHM